MTIRNLIQIAVLKTNPYWPFSFLNQLPYYFAIQVFIGFYRRFPVIKSVYLRHPLVKGKWTPALSDLDITIIIDSRLNVKSEYEFINDFWRKMIRLKKLFPMIGEIEILDDNNINSWILFGTEGYFTHHWKLLYGKPVINNFRTYNHMLNIESRKYAFWLYLQFVLNKFHSLDQPSYLARKEMKRLAMKTQRCLYVSCNSNDIGQTLYKSEYTRTGLLYTIMQELQKNILYYDSLNSNICNIRNERSPFPENVKEGDFRVGLENIFRQFATLGRCNEAIKSILLNENQNFYIILNDNANRPLVERCLCKIRQMFANHVDKPIILTSVLFQYLILFYDPYEYYQLLNSRIIVYGQDPLQNISPPDDKAFIHFWVNQIPTLLLIPRNSDFFPHTKIDQKWKKQVASYIRRFLVLKLLLEYEIIEHTYNKIFADLQKYYPQEYEELNLLRGASPKNVTGTDKWKWFQPLRKLNSDIQKLLSDPSKLHSMLAPLECMER